MNVKFLGWCYQPENGHDKVWGLLDKGNDEYMTFWARRGKKMQTNTKTMTTAECHNLVRQKLMKGYREVPKDEMDNVYDHFGRDLFKLILKGK